MTISPIYTILIPVKRSGIPHGFPGQTFQVLPTELRGAMRLIPALCDFAFTDIGRYPRARRHYYRRSGGSEQHILILCESGSGSVKIEEREFTLEPDRFVIIPAGKPHEYWSSSSRPWTISWCHFQGLRGADFTCAAPVDQSPFAIDSDLITRVKSLFSMAFDIVERGYTLEHAAAASSLVPLNPLPPHLRQHPAYPLPKTAAQPSRRESHHVHGSQHPAQHLPKRNRIARRLKRIPAYPALLLSSRRRPHQLPYPRTHLPCLPLPRRSRTPHRRHRPHSRLRRPLLLLKSIQAHNRTIPPRLPSAQRITPNHP